MIVLVTGPFGSGKTSFCRSLLAEIEEGPIPIWYSVGDVRNFGDDWVDDLLSLVSSGDTVHNVILDENYRLYDSRMYGSSLNKRVAFLANTIGGLFVASAQEIAAVDKRIRTNCSVHVECKNYDYSSGILDGLVTHTRRYPISLSLGGGVPLLDSPLLRVVEPAPGLGALE